MQKNKMPWIRSVLGLVVVMLVIGSLLLSQSITKEDQVEEVVQTSEELDVEVSVVEFVENTQNLSEVDKIEEVVEEIEYLSEGQEVDLTTADNIGLINIDYHSVDEILTLYHLMGLDESVGIIFSEELDLNYLTTSGKLDISTQQEALNTLNFARDIAGISYDVSINDEYGQNSQDAALALASLGGVQNMISINLTACQTKCLHPPI